MAGKAKYGAQPNDRGLFLKEYVNALKDYRVFVLHLDQ